MENMLIYKYILKRRYVLRVISGKAKGHKLKAPKGDNVRPTEDRIKESLFNIIRNISSQAIILDAFGGSGAIGIEFLSRGADKVYFVDNNPASISVIQENLNHTKLLDRAEITKADIILAIKKFSNKNLKFDYIYLDPPFSEYTLLDNVFKSISEENILDIDGILIVEHGKSLNLEDILYGFKKIDRRSYGNKIIEFYKKNTEEALDESSLSR